MLKVEKSAQIFEVNGQFIPTKASVYLLTNLYNNSNYFNVTSQTIIDASNFSSLTLNSQRIFFTDEEVGYSGAGYLIYPSVIYSSTNPNDFNVINYPIRHNGNNDIYARIKDSVIGSCTIEVYLDSVLQDTNVISTSGNWEWIYLGKANIIDDNIHILGIKLIGNGVIIDQIGVNIVGGTPGSGIALTQTTSPYITTHANIYNLDVNLLPTTSLYINDFKTSLDEIVQDGWYNFNLNFIKSSIVFGFPSSYALVLSVAGSNNKNYISWEKQKSENDMTEPSIYR